MQSKTRTLKDLAREAIDVQNACNLSGILLGAHNAMIELRALMGAPCNSHPIMRAWASKIADMTGNYNGEYPAAALDAILTAPDSDADVRRSTAAYIKELESDSIVTSTERISTARRRAGGGLI